MVIRASSALQVAKKVQGNNSNDKNNFKLANIIILVHIQMPAETSPG